MCLLLFYAHIKCMRAHTVYVFSSFLLRCYHFRIFPTNLFVLKTVSKRLYLYVYNGFALFVINTDVLCVPTRRKRKNVFNKLNVMFSVGNDASHIICFHTCQSVRLFLCQQADTTINFSNFVFII